MWVPISCIGQCQTHGDLGSGPLTKNDFFSQKYVCRPTSFAQSREFWAPRVDASPTAGTKDLPTNKSLTALCTVTHGPQPGSSGTMAFSNARVVMT